MKPNVSLGLLTLLLAAMVGPEGAIATPAIGNPTMPLTAMPLAQTWGILDSEPAPPAPTAAPSETVSPNLEEPKTMPSPSEQLRAAQDRYRTVIDQTVAMVNNPEAQRLAQRFGLNILNITWEDTGRYKGSSVGPNISDMTIQVQQRDLRSGQYNLSLMPVIRHPNFSDETADVDLDKFFVLVGNEKGKDLQRVSVRELLGNLRQYLHEPESWKGRQLSLLAPRDSHALVSAQAAFLPIPQTGEAQFNPVLFNYQSYPDNPAVLTILATREGTSVTVIDNTRDGFEAGATWGQRLFFNKNGERASLTGKRLSDFNREGDSNAGDSSAIATAPNVTEADGVNMVLLIQVPLKQKEQPRQVTGNLADGANLPMAAAPTAAMEAAKSDVEAAVVGHGAVEGPFTEIDNLAIERDPRFPIRATVQFYKATSNGIVSESDLQQIHQQISRVYAGGDYVGSLVTEGATQRPTEYDGPKQEPPDWWSNFWQRHEQNTGQSRGVVWDLWQRLLGQ